MKHFFLVLFSTCLLFSTFAQSQRSLNVFNKISFAEKPFTLTGTIAGYDPAVDSFQYASVIYNHLFKHDQQTLTLEIDKKGAFSITFPLNRPQEIMFEFGDDLISVYAIPGSALNIRLDLPAFKKISRLPDEEQVKMEDPITFSGPYAQLNNECNTFSTILACMHPYKEHYRMIDSLDQMDYKTYRLRMMQRALDSLSAFNDRKNTSTEFRQLMTQSIRYQAADDLLRYRFMHKRQKQMKLRVVFTPAYLDFLTTIPLNNEEAVITEHYSSFIQNYLDWYRNDEGRRQQLTMPEFIGWMKNKGKPLLPEEEKLVLGMEKASDTTHKEEVNALIQKYIGDLNEFLAQDRFLALADTMEKGIPAGIGRDLLYTSLIASYLDKNKLPLTPQQSNTIAGKIANNGLRAQIVRDNERLANVLSGKLPEAAHVRTNLQVSEDQFFAELMKPYKGKVVYIDFWAPWCGPCMGEMPDSKKLHKELSGKDVVFLYIAIDCTRQSWEKTIKEQGLEGEHYFANVNEAKLLSGKFNISGIPHYVLIDKEGKVKDDNASRPSEASKTLRKINELLKK